MKTTTGSSDRNSSRKSKGELTAERILDAAEVQFAQRGYNGTSLREIARQAGLHEPGLYNHFKNKEKLYAAMLDRALIPLVDVLHAHLDNTDGIQAYTELPSLMIDLLMEHPQIPALFQQALQGDNEVVGNQMIQEWLDRLVALGAETMQAIGNESVDHADIAIMLIAMFNLCTGYFLSQRLFETMADGHITDPENIARQKQLVGRLQRAVLIR